MSPHIFAEAKQSCVSPYKLIVLPRGMSRPERQSVLQIYNSLPSTRLHKDYIQLCPQFLRVAAKCPNDDALIAAQALVTQFQTQADIPVFLLTSQVGGLGLTLTAADRVIILDPSWNPSLDNQSVDRAYRIGQSKDVVVRAPLSSESSEARPALILELLYLLLTDG